VIRTTPEAVKGVLLRDYDRRSGPDLAPYITTASVLVDRCEAFAYRKSLTATPADLELVERWLAAHFYCVSDRTYKSKGQQGASGSFDGNTGMDLDATLYGQSARMIDPSGYLGVIGKEGGVQVGGFWAGYRDPPPA
jgi:hypothetical protein